MLLLQRVTAGKIGYGAGNTQDAVVGAGRKMQTLCGEAKKMAAALVEGAKTIQGFAL